MTDNVGSSPVKSEVDQSLPATSTASELTRMLKSGSANQDFLSLNHGQSNVDEASNRSSDDNDNDDDDHDEEADDYVSVEHSGFYDYMSLFRRPPPRQKTKLDELHPFVSVLGLSNLEDCIRVEEAFPEHERCSREKFIYRLSTCPELSLGMFTMPPLKEGQPKPRPELIGHIVSTRTSSPTVTDASMSFPPDWRTRRRRIPEPGQEALGHEDQGGTIAIHSLAVVPQHQHKKVASTLMKSYIERIRESKIADRLALLAHDNLIPFYESLGFENRGPSSCTFGGGGWYDMVLEFSNVPPSDGS
ncbi:hypothetical protein VTN31DRAFT_3196 [Thermomyces dupontii]|uniref:uncharacterized protein n=1 Tax=Talaromyces thermophilus TaxID=28565 RepID=UPI00374393C5